MIYKNRHKQLKTNLRNRFNMFFLKAMLGVVGVRGGDALPQDDVEEPRFIFSRSSSPTVILSSSPRVTREHNCVTSASLFVDEAIDDRLTSQFELGCRCSRRAASHDFGSDRSRTDTELGRFRPIDFLIGCDVTRCASTAAAAAACWRRSICEAR